MANSQGRNSRCWIPGAQAPQDPNERFLRHVLGILAMPQHAIAKAEDLTAVVVDQFDHGRLVAA